MEDNGVTRRELEALFRRLEELDRAFERLDREGSRATTLLARDVVDISKRVDAIQSNFTWAVRGIVGVIFVVLAGVLIAYASGSIGGQ
jgi:hypothetical protein